MGKENPSWLQQVREFCRNERIEICGWGADTLVVRAQSPDRARQVASQLQSFGFVPVEDEDDAGAGLLTLSRNPEVTRAEQLEVSTSFDFSKRPMRERIAPILEAALCVWLFWYIATQPQRSKLPVVLALVMLVIFLRDGSRLWGWSIRMSPEEFRVRRYFRWTAVPWAQIRGVELTGARSRNNEGVALTLAPEGQLQLGAFVYPFARALRDHLREEIAKRRGQST